MIRLHVRSIFSFLLLLVLVSTLHAQELPVGKAEELGFSQERLQRLTSVFQAYVDDKKMSGSVILVARHGKVAYFNSFGKRDIEANAPMQNDVIFRIE